MQPIETLGSADTRQPGVDFIVLPPAPKVAPLRRSYL
jgi:hypothetical protein